MQTLANLIQKQFIGTDDLRKDLTGILANLAKTGGEIVITQHGKPVAILMSITSYEKLQNQLAKYH